RMTHRNSVNWVPDESMTAIRAGQGLLVGLLRCGHCGRKLHVRYWGGTGFEQQGEQHSLVLPDDWNESVRHAENDVIVGNRQALLLPRSKPLITCVGLTLRAMPVST